MGEPREAGRTRSLGEAVGALSLLRYDEPTAAIEEVAALAVEVVPGAVAAAVVAGGRGRLETLAGSGAASRTLARLEARSGRGPCTESLRQNEPVAAGDGLARWPGLARAAQRSGIRCAACAPFGLDGGTGGVCVYGPANELTREAKAAAAAFAHHAGAAVANAVAASRQAAGLAALEHAVHTREVVALAKGILMERHGVDEAVALAALVKASQRDNRKLRAVAEDVVAGRPRFGGDAGSGMLAMPSPRARRGF